MQVGESPSIYSTHHHNHYHQFLYLGPRSRYTSASVNSASGHMCNTGLELPITIRLFVTREMGMKDAKVYPQVDIKIGFSGEEDLESKSWNVIGVNNFSVDIIKILGVARLLVKGFINILCFALNSFVYLQFIGGH